jgi:hypothetical protein
LSRLILTIKSRTTLLSLSVARASRCLATSPLDWPLRSSEGCITFQGLPYIYTYNRCLSNHLRSGAGVSRRQCYRSTPLGYGLAEDAIWRTYVTRRVRSDKIMTSTCQSYIAYTMGLGLVKVNCAKNSNLCATTLCPIALVSAMHCLAEPTVTVIHVRFQP